MANLITAINDALTIIVDFLGNLIDGLTIIVITIGNLFTSASQTLWFMPSVMGGVAITAFSLIIVLRIVGR